MQVTTVGLDLAKNIFQVHGIDDNGEVAFNRALRRAQVLAFFERLEPCLVGIEACGTSHHWARELIKLGHNVKLIPPAYVKPYVKRGKSDAVDAAAICEAVTRPTMRFVEVKTPEQQAILSVHRTRDLIVRQRTQTINMMRAQLAEFGIVLPQGVYHALQFAKDCVDGEQPNLPNDAQEVVFDLCEQLLFLHTKILRHTRHMTQIAKGETGGALAHHTGRRSDYSISNHCDRWQRETVQQWQGVCGVAGTDTVEQIKWREGTLGSYLKNGRPIHPPIIGPRHDVPYPHHKVGAGKV